MPIETRARRGLAEFAIYAAVSVTAAVTLCVLFVRAPVVFTTIITEDSWAEYLGAVGFAVAGGAMLLLAGRHGPIARRASWIAIGLGCLFVAGEEISWGQRILGLETPDAVREANLQGELSVHNLTSTQFIFARIHLISYAIVVWLGFSFVVSTWFPRLRERLLAIGTPIIPGRLAPVFLLVPFFWLYYPTAKSEEFAEAFLGLAAMVWAIDLFWSQTDVRLPVLRAQGAALVFALAVSGLLTRYFSPFPEHAWRMNVMAWRDYPNWRMLDQSERLYRFIYSNPEYRLPTTRTDHARVRIRAGNVRGAVDVLVQGAEELAGSDHASPSFFEQVRGLTETLASAPPFPGADSALYEALSLEPSELAELAAADQRAQGLSQDATELEGSGDVCGAFESLTEAKATAISVELKRLLGDRLDSLSRTNSRALSECEGQAG